MAVFEVPMSGAGPYFLRVVYTVTPQSGGMLVAATAQWRRDARSYSSYQASAPFTLNIGGNTKSGTRSFSANAGGAIGPQWIESHQVLFTSGASTYITVTFSPGTSEAGSGSINSLTVPIATASASTFSPSSTLNAGTAVTVNTNRQSSAFTHDITYEFGSATGTIGTGVGASASWTPPLSMLTAIPNLTQAAGTIRTVTKNGTTVVGTTITGFVLKAPASVVPTVSSISALEQNPDVASIVGRYVKSLSVVKLTVASAGAYGSTIKTSTATVAGATVNSGGSVVVAQAGNLTVTGKVTDSRGRTGAGTATLPVLDYSPPTVSAYRARRSNSAGTLDDDGTHVRVDLTAAIKSLVNGTERNALTLRVFTRVRGGSAWTARNVITGALSYNSWFVLSGGGIYGTTTSYDVRVQVHDKFGYYTADTTLATTKVTLDLAPGGVGAGKIHERGGLDVAGPIYSDNNVVAHAGNLSYGLFTGGSTQRVPGGSFNNAIETGFYYGIGPDDSASPGAGWWNVTVENAGSRSTQYARKLDSNFAVVKRWREAPSTLGTWTPWQVVYWEREATQGEVNTATAGNFAVTPATLRNSSNLPWSSAAGVVSTGASGSTTVTFPAGRFTQPPNISLTPGVHANVLIARLASAPTTTSMAVQTFTMPAAAQVASTVNWQAMQMSSGSASG